MNIKVTDIFKMASNLNYSHYTEYAKVFINEKLNHDNVVQIKEHISIDGCDRFGPKAYIYYLFVTQKNPQYKKSLDSTSDKTQLKYIFEIYTADQYFHEDEIVEYELYTFTKSNKLHRFRSWEDYHKIDNNYKNNIVTDDNDEVSDNYDKSDYDDYDEFDSSEEDSKYENVKDKENDKEN
jgi:hypothetical protein